MDWPHISITFMEHAGHCLVRYACAAQQRCIFSFSYAGGVDQETVCKLLTNRCRT
jgi:hypothetical protein